MSLLYKINYLFTWLISLLLSTILVYSSKIMFGVNFAKEFYFYAILILVICCCLSYVLLETRIKININIFDILIFIFCLWCFIRRPFHSFDDTESVKIIAFLFLYFAIKSFSNNPLIEGGVLSQRYVLIIMIVFFAVAIIEIIFGLFQLYGILPSFNSNFAITGTTSNPAIFSMFLAAVYPVALSWHLLASNMLKNRYVKYVKFLALLVLLMILSVLPLTMIRSAWIGVIGSSIVVLYYCNSKISKTVKSLLRNKKKVYIIISCVPFVILSLFYLYNIKPQSAFGRLFIWEVTLNEIKENPLIGIGYKQYQVEYNNWQAKYFIENTKNIEKERVADNVEFAYNEYLQILSETGIVGFLLFVLIVYYFIRQISCRLKVYGKVREKTDLKFILIISTFSCSISILLMALVSYPFQILPIEILFVICLGVFSGNLDKSVMRKSLNLRYSFLIKIILVCFLVCIIIMSFVQIYKIPSYIKWKEAVTEYSKQEYSSSVAIYRDIYHRMSDNGWFLLYYGTTLIANNDCQKGIQILEDAKKRISDPIIYIKIGDCKKKLKAYKEAETNYLLASAMIPNRIYPKYLLALLFDESEQYEKAYQYAKEVIETEAKISNTAVLEMKKTMADLILKYEAKIPLKECDKSILLIY